MNTEAIYSDETGQYAIPMEANPGDRVTIRLRVAHGHAGRSICWRRIRIT